MQEEDVENVIYRRGAYLLLALMATGPLVACGDPDIFARVAPPATDEKRAAVWPKLAEIPPAPPKGVFTAAAPDPATGDAIQIDLAVAAEEAASRNVALSGPVK